jgi:hypothetical protein
MELSENNILSAMLPTSEGQLIIELQNKKIEMVGWPAMLLREFETFGLNNEILE